MNRHRLYFIALVSGLLAACAPSTSTEPYRTEIAAYEITGYDGPKHVYVDLRAVETGETFTHVYVSKHFNAHREKLVPGRVVTLTRHTYRSGGTDTTSFVNLYDALHQD